VIQNNVLRETLLDEEHRWLSLIDENELGKKYYNLRKHKLGHWSTDIDKSKTIKEKLSIARRKRIITKETKRRTSITLKGKKKAKFSEQHKLNLSIAAKGKTKAKWTEERKKAAGMRQIGRKLSKETKEKISNTLKNKCQS
jgi:monoamine oxidase